MNVSHLIVLVVIVAAMAALWISAVVSVLRVHEQPAWTTAVWLLVTLVLPILGPIVWFAVGRSRGAAAAD
jgi:hypothetical protein